MQSFFLVIIICLQISPTATPVASSAPAQMSQEQLEQRFAETLSGTVLTGSFTTDGQEVGDPIKPETYTIHKVRTSCKTPGRCGNAWGPPTGSSRVCARPCAGRGCR